MLKALSDWLDHRTGCKKIVHEALYENVPGGARWRYVWGSTLTFALAVQFITGIFLWMAYSPSSQTASFHGAGDDSLARVAPDASGD